MSQPIDLYLLTYNCNKRSLDAENFVSRLLETFPDEPAQLYVVGVQELCSILDGCFEESASRHLIALNEVLIEALQEKYGRETVSGFQTVGMEHVGAIGMVAITPFPSKFHHVKSARAGCGYLQSSMKGAVAIRMSYSPLGRYSGQSNTSRKETTELTFASAHLSAYEGEVYYRRRNSQVHDLMRGLDFGDGYGLLKPSSHCFFMGDLNYRTTKKFDVNDNCSKDLFKLQDQQIQSTPTIESLVLQYDELTMARANGEVFTGFGEGCIDFAPTYKYQIGTAIYNPKRSPSWCDRILFQSTYKHPEGGTIQQKAKLRKNGDVAERLPKIHRYNSIKTINSDHQPVYLNLTVPFEAPESIISSTGYLQILPSSTPNSHYRHDEAEEEDLLLRTNTTSEVISGPTQIYMSPTKWDTFVQTYVRWFTDRAIGYGLWFGTVPKGRISVLVLVLLIWGIYSIN
ncbi:hypothetical protein CAAN1_03S06524 [[Candida] anglica]|uniref:Inositol polyphosphate-related phosphatase domain-containing protein n=1 Tax=[Candida] anglica TaxID=148631 RepID=A0ABP0EH89_9ASCO